MRKFTIQGQATFELRMHMAYVQQVRNRLTSKVSKDPVLWAMDMDLQRLVMHFDSNVAPPLLSAAASL
jgi:hypothetical protein